MNALGSIWILLLVLLVTSDAMGRSFFARPIAGVTELVQISIVGIVFLQLADAIRTGRLTRADSFLTLLRIRPSACRAAAGRRLLPAGRDLHGAGALGLAAAADRGHTNATKYLGNQGVFTVIVWPIKAVIVLGLLVCLIEFLRQALRVLAPGQRLTPANPGCARHVPLAYRDSDGHQQRRRWASRRCIAIVVSSTPAAHRGRAGLVSFVGVLLLKGNIDVALNLLGLAMADSVTDEAFATVPLFVMMGLVVSRCGLGRDVYEFGNAVFQERARRAGHRHRCRQRDLRGRHRLVDRIGLGVLPRWPFPR